MHKITLPGRTGWCAVKALTIKQPWAWAIATGHKLIENRTWPTGYRGPLAIHSGQSVDSDAIPMVRQLLIDLGVLGENEKVDQRDLLVTGAVLAVGEMVGVCSASVNGIHCDCGPWAAPGQHHWQITNVRTLAKPVPARGRLGLWDVTLARDPHPTERDLASAFATLAAAHQSPGEPR